MNEHACPKWSFSNEEVDVLFFFSFFQQGQFPRHPALWPWGDSQEYTMWNISHQPQPKGFVERPSFQWCSESAAGWGWNNPTFLAPWYLCPSVILLLDCREADLATCFYWIEHCKCNVRSLLRLGYDPPCLPTLPTLLALQEVSFYFGSCSMKRLTWEGTGGGLQPTDSEQMNNWDRQSNNL